MKKRCVFIKKRLNKQGFTLTELLVVLALLAIISAMVATFAHSMGNYAKLSEDQYSFLENSTRAKQDTTNWLYLTDKQDTTIYPESFSFSDGTFLYESTKIGEYKDIDNITVYVSDDKKMIRFVFTYAENGKEHSYSFVLAPRCAKIEVSA